MMFLHIYNFYSFLYPNIPKLITVTFIMNLKELQDKYLSFVQKYIYEELDHVNENMEECLRMIENITTI